MFRHTDWADEWVRYQREQAAALRRGLIELGAEVRTGWEALDRTARAWVLVAAAVAVGLCLWVAVTDRSPAMSAGEVADLEAWAAGTQSAEVRAALSDALRNGEVTRNEASAVIERSKGAEIPVGLLSPIEAAPAGAGPGEQGVSP